MPVIILALTVVLGGAQAMAADGLITLRSSFGPKETMDRLDVAVRAKGLTVFARIDHAGGATEVGLPLRPTELLIFGNAQGGTPLMQSDQTIGIDLPLKDTGLAGQRGRQHVAFLQRSGLGRETARAEPEPRPVFDALRPPSARSPGQRRRRHSGGASRSSLDHAFAGDQL